MVVEVLVLVKGDMKMLINKCNDGCIVYVYVLKIFFVDKYMLN
jgi:hypothetical protein